MKHSLKLATTGLVLAAFLTACGNTSDGETPADLVAVTDAESSDPWARYTPWDSDGADVKTTGSGLEYIELAEGSSCDGGPTGADRAVVHYEGRLAKDGTVFDSSLGRGEAIEFPANGVIKGWTETLGLMCPGDDWLIYLPADLAYGDSPRPGGPIGPGDALVFRVVLLADIAEGDWNGSNFEYVRAEKVEEESTLPLED